ncbi:hypothetical protein LTR95_015217 [Oleoguttula sp. CCFEE 5521]
MTMFTMKKIIVVALLTSFVAASGIFEWDPEIEAIPTSVFESAQSTVLIPNHVDPSNLPPAWPKSISSAMSVLNHTTTTTSLPKAVPTATTTHLSNMHTLTTTVATDTYPPGPAAFHSTEVNVGAAVESSGRMTTSSSSSSCTSTKITIKSTHTMTTTHVIPAPPPGEVTLPAQPQRGGEHPWSGIDGGMMYGTGMAHGPGMAHGTGMAKPWPTQPVGAHGHPHGEAGVHPSGILSARCEQGTGSVKHKPTRAAGRHECPQGQDCAHQSGMSNAQVFYGTGAAPAKPIQSPWEPGHPLGPPPGVSPNERQQHGGEHGQEWQAGQHPH